MTQEKVKCSGACLAVAQLMEKEPHGCSATWARRLNIKRKTLVGRLRVLRNLGFAAYDRDAKFWALIRSADDLEAFKGRPVTEVGPMRDCMRCGRAFPSQHVGVRHCSSCRRAVAELDF